MRYLFLDIDGVLNSSAFFKSLTGRPDPKDEDEMTRGMIDPAAVAVLNEILDKTRASIVISSTWRLAFRPGMIARALVHNGFRHHRRIVGSTPRLSGERGNEIAAWLAENPADAFAILDDDTDMAHLGKHLVRTFTGEGLLREHVAPCLALLNPPSPDKE